MSVLGPRRLARIEGLIREVPRRLASSKTRYESLNRLAGNYRVSYETLKKDLYALAYAFVPKRTRLGRERQEALNRIPRSYRGLVRELRDLARDGKLDQEKARKAAELFLEHSPDIDIKERIMARLWEEGINEDEEIEARLEKLARYLGMFTKYRTWFWEAHPAKAYAYSWSILGKKIHREIEEAIRLGNRIHNARRRESRGWPTREDLDILSLSEGISGRARSEVIRNLVIKVLDHNRLFYEFLFHVESAKHHHISLYLRARKHLDKLGRTPKVKGRRRRPEDLGLGDKLENVYKAIRRWEGPRKSWRDFPRYFKRDAREHYSRFSGLMGIGAPRSSWGKLGLESYVNRKLAIIGYHLDRASRIYAEILDREREDRVLGMIIGRRSRRRFSRG